MDFVLALSTIFISTFCCCLASEGGNSSSLYILYQSVDGNNSDELIFRDDVAYVGRTNNFLEIDLATSPPRVAKLIDFPTDETSRQLCEQFSPDSDCENTVKVLQFTSPKTLLVCGTNAKQAKCFHYSMENSTFEEVNLGAKVWLTESPATKTLSAVLPKPSKQSNEIYIAASKGVFYRKNAKPLKTGGMNAFKEPEFKGIFHSDEKDFVYLLFNEKSGYFVRENFDSTNTKEDYYSMVARVCQNDQGGTWKTETFMTFNKVRLVCPWPGPSAGNKANVYYNELISSHQIGSSIVGLFRLNRNWNLDNYAVAEYDTDVIDDVITGKTTPDNRTRYFCESESGGSAVSTTFDSTSDDPFLPGQCPQGESYTLRSDFEQFALRCTLTEAVVPPVRGRPFFVGDSKQKFKFIFAQKFSWTTVVLLLTENGYLKKIATNADGVAVEILEKQTMKTDETILAAKLIESKGYILATTTTKVVTIPVSFCDSQTDCTSCHVDPHCHWKADLDNLVFECVSATNFMRRTCAAPPQKPKALSSELSREELRVSWDRDMTAKDVKNLITVMARKTREVATRRTTTETSLIVKRSRLKDGCRYDVTARALNGTSLSEESRSTFATGMLTPVLTVTEEDKAIRVRWSSVPEASRYVILLANHGGETMQEVVFPAKSKNRDFYFHDFERGNRYTVGVRALSEDEIESNATDEVTPAIISVTEPSLVLEGSLNADSSTVATTSVVETDRPTSTEALARPQQTTQAEQQPLPTQRGKTGVAAANVAGDCLGVTVALIIIVPLFVLTLIVLLHNLWSIKPQVKQLKNDIDGSYYKRQHLLIWSKRHGKAHINGGDMVVSTTTT